MHDEIFIKPGEIVNITKDMIILDVIQVYPETIEVMREMGLHCIGCQAAGYESIHEGALVHGIDPELLCQKLNQKILEKRKKLP